MTESARKALISRENTASRRHRTEISSGLPTDRISEAVESNLNIEDMSNNAGEQSNSNINRPNTNHNQTQDPNSSALMELANIPGVLDEEEGDDYESDFEKPNSTNITPVSATSPFPRGGRIKSRTGSNNVVAFSPKMHHSNRS